MEKILSKCALVFLFILIVDSLKAQVIEVEDFEGGIFPPQGWNIQTGNFTQGSLPQFGINSCQNSQLVSLLGLGRAIITSKPFDMRGRAAQDSAFVRFWHINSSVITVGQQPINVFINDTNDITGAVQIGTVTPQLSYDSSNFVIPGSFNGPRNYLFFEITAPLLSLIPSIHFDNVSWATFPIVTADIKMYLEGPYDSGNMTNMLNTRGQLPISQPYNNAPYNYNGSESVDSSFFTSHPDITDWVMIELRQHDTSSTFISRRAAFIRTNGKIVDLDGTSPVTFSDVTSGTYYVVIYHRNHLISMSSSGLVFNILTTSYDFTTGAGQFYGGDAKDLGGGAFGMYAGDPENDGNVNHQDLIEESIQQSSIQYNKADTNMDGEVDAADYEPTDSNIGKVATVPYIE